jgi:hypothetical protein
LIELVTDCVVCIGLFDVEVFILVFPARLFFVPVLSAKAESPTGTRHDRAVFFDSFRARCKNPSIVLSVVWQGRTHFIAAAAQLMRRIILGHARERPRTQAWRRSAESNDSLIKLFYGKEPRST